MENLTHQMAMPTGIGELEGNDNLQDSQLKTIYDRHGGRVYSLCLRLLANQKAAESATADAFVMFSKELSNQQDEARTLDRLRELAINASLIRIRGRSQVIARRLIRKAGRSLLRVFGPVRGTRP